MSPTKIRKFLHLLASGSSVKQALASVGASPIEASREINHGYGLRERRAARSLARLNVEMRSYHRSLAALKELSDMIASKERPDIQLRASLAVLSLAGFSIGPRNRTRRARAKPLPKLTPKQKREALARADHLSANLIRDFERNASRLSPPRTPPDSTPRKPK